MILTTIDGRALYLIDDRPEGGEFNLTATVIANQQAGETNREERRALGESIRLKAEYTIQLEGLAARTCAKHLRTMGAEKVAAPIWPAAKTWALRAQASITAGLYLLLRPRTTTVAVFAAGTPPGWQVDTDIVVPLVVGYLEEREMKWKGESLARLNVRLIENSAPEWAVAGTSYTALSGPNPAGLAVAPPIIPFPSDWADPRQSHMVKIEREQIGFQREVSETHRAFVKVARAMDFTAFLDPDEGWPAGKLLKWFSDHGAGRVFWTPTKQRVATLAQAADANTISLQLAPGDAANLALGDYLAVVTAHRVTCYFGPVSLISGNNVFFAAGTTPEIPAGTRLVSLVLGRLNKKEIKIEFNAERLAIADFVIRELPPEASPTPANETAGVTLGQLPTRAWLYTFTRSIGATGILGGVVSEDDDTITYIEDEDLVSEDDLSSTVSLGGTGGLISEDAISITFTSGEEEGIVDTFTSFERDLEDDDLVYFSRPITHGARTQGIALDQDKLTIICDGLNVPPILETALLRSETPCRVVIERCDVVSGAVTNRQTIFTGELGGCKIAGKKLSANAVSGGTFFDLKAPRFNLQAGCNHALFSPGCGLLASAWEHTGVINDPGTAGYPFQFGVASLARPAGGAVLTVVDAFAGGWVEIDTGAVKQRRAILASSAMGIGGSITLTLQSDPYPYPTAGTVISMYPGCDNAAATCQQRFGNYANFGGHPKVPKGNPSLFKLSEKQGGKK